MVTSAEEIGQDTLLQEVKVCHVEASAEMERVVVSPEVAHVETAREVVTPEMAQEEAPTHRQGRRGRNSEDKDAISRLGEPK